MHPALTKDDIIVEILEHLALIQRPPKLDSALRTSRYWRPPATSPELFTSCAEDDIAICKRHALHSLALTCKAFSAHALNELWAAPLGGLYSVLKLFSSFIAKDGRIGVPSHRFDTTKPLLQHYFLEGEITPREWSTFKKYAARVREIGYYVYPAYGAQHNIDPSVFIALHELNGGQPLFPNLRFLAWSRCPRITPTSQSEPADNSPEGYEKLLRMLVTPSIDMLSLWHPSLQPDGKHELDANLCVFPPGVDDDVKTISLSCPRLRHVFIQLRYSSTALAALTSCRELRTFKVCRSTYMEPESFSYLSRNPALEVFEGNVDHYHSAEHWDNSDGARAQRVLQGLTFPPGSFPKLRKLVLKGVLLSIAAPVLRAVSSDVAPEINVTSGQHDILENLSSFLEALTTQNFTYSLTTLNLCLWNITTDMSADTTIRFGDHFGPLRFLIHLTELALRIYDRILHISESDMRYMTSAWPEMSVLSLTSRLTFSGFEDLPDYPSLPSAVRFARSFPRMLFLHCDIMKPVEEDASALNLKPAGWEPPPVIEASRQRFSVAVLADGYERVFVRGAAQIPLMSGSITRVRHDMEPWNGGRFERGKEGWYWDQQSDNISLYLVPLTRL